MLYANNNAFANPSSGASSGSLTEDAAGGAYKDTLRSVSADGRTLTLRSTADEHRGCAYGSPPYGTPPVHPSGGAPPSATPCGPTP